MDDGILKGRVDLLGEELIGLLCGLVDKDTTNPPGNEYLVADMVKEFFTANSIRYEVFEKTPGRRNIIGYVGEGSPRILVACHSDVVPAGAGWKTNPFRPVIKDGKIYGRGTSDNKGCLASMLIMGKILKENEKSLKGQVILACVADEETGSEQGLEYLMDIGALKFDHAIIPDIEGNMRKVDVAEKGALFISAVSYGMQAHGSTPSRGVNAVWNMMDFLEKVRAYRMEYEPHPLLKSPTINLGYVRGGTAANIVPGECEAGIDIRYLPSQDKDMVLSDLQRMAEDVRKANPKSDIRLTVMNHHLPAESKDLTVANLFADFTEDVTGERPAIVGLGGHTFAGLLMARGYNAIGVGMGEDVAHEANEYLEIDQLHKFTKVLTLTVDSLIGGDGNDISGK